MDGWNVETLGQRGWARASQVLTLIKQGKSIETIQNVVDRNNYIKHSELEIMDKLGSGAFATVYLAKYKGREVAVKMLKEEHLSKSSEVRLFMDEIGLMKKLQHENIVELIGMGGIRTGETYLELFVVQELLRGGSLRDLVANQMINLHRDLYTIRQAVTWSLEIAAALQYLHTANPKVGHLLCGQACCTILLFGEVLCRRDIGTCHIQVFVSCT